MHSRRRAGGREGIKGKICTRVAMTTTLSVSIRSAGRQNVEVRDKDMPEKQRPADVK